MGWASGSFWQNGQTGDPAYASRTSAVFVHGFSGSHQFPQKNLAPIVHFGLIACTVGIELFEKA